VLPLGDARIDSHLPGGGLPIGQLHEIGAEGREAQTAAVIAAFAATLAGNLARTDPSRVLLWIAPCCDLYPPGLLPYGIDPANLILVQTRTDAETLQAMETALRSGAASVVLGEVRTTPRLAGRRLQLASLQHQTTSLLLRRSTTAADPTGAVTRWRVGPADTQSETRRWRLALLHARAGRPGEWIVETDDATHSLRVAAVLGNDTAAPRAHPGRRAAR
jgi:protein ImuA